MEMKNYEAGAGLRGHICDGTPADIVERYASLPNLVDQVDLAGLDDNVVVVDTETTGFSFTHDELIQIAAARMEKGQVTGWYITFVNPGQPIPDDIVHLTGIGEEEVRDAPSPQEALAGLVEFAGNSLMVAHNVGFDRTFVTRHPEGYPLLDNIWVDSLDLSRIALPRLKSHRLIDLVRTFGAPTSTHRADDDVAATCVVYRILLTAISQMPPSLVAYIGSMAPLEEWPTGYVFAQMAAANERRAASERGEVCSNQAADVDGEALELSGAAKTSKQAYRFSLFDMRRRRVSALPQRRVKKDAEELAANPLTPLEFPTKDEIDAAFDASGVLGRIYGDFEPRAEQREMSEAIAAAFATSENLVVEAGTGVGKSMAYLVPAAMTAQRNGITVGVATKTNALLDQLVFKELPALARALEGQNPEKPPLTWASLKGISHYPCLRKIGRLVDDGPAMREVGQEKVSQAPALAALLSYVEQSEFDDIDALKIDYRALPRYQITTTSVDCLKRKCPYYGTTCVVHGARRRAESADIVVTNHSLLFCDVVADGGLLPPIRYWIIDEAHGAEEEVRKAFTQVVGAENVMRIANRVVDAAGSRNVFARAERAGGAEGENLSLLFALTSKCREAGNAFYEVADDFTLHMKDLLYFDAANKAKGYDNVDLWVNDDVRKSTRFADLALRANAFIESSDKLIAAAQDLVAYLEDVDGAAEAQREVASLALELRDLRNAAETFFCAAPETYVYQAALVKKKDRRIDSMQAMPLSVGALLNESLYARTHSVIYTSATLSVSGKFTAFEHAVGLGEGEYSKSRSLQLDSSYDFDNNMVIYVIKDMPEPGDHGYLPALQKLLVETHIAQQGSMLTLFTNRREMEQCYDAVNPQLKEADLRLVCQKWGVSVKGLRDDFMADEHLSLFALKSFWQGFDAPGATLKGVIIPKLPFARPTDPLYCERAAREDNAWRRYVLPQAVIETKQAAGRLIRKADDHGVLILADKRLITKSYGKTFLNSLQSKTVRVCTMAEVVRSLAAMVGW